MKAFTNIFENQIDVLISFRKFNERDFYIIGDYIHDGEVEVLD